MRKMPEPEEEKSKSERRDSFMDLDFDLESSWPLDQICFVPSNPMSPLLLSSSSEQPCSPLWAFSDEDAAANAGFRFSDYPIVCTCNTSSAAGNVTENDDSSNRKIPSPLLEWIPMESSDQYCVIKERMTQALRSFKESTEQHVLAQLWAPVKNGGRCVLTTSGQPFVLDPHSTGLHQYRMVSLMYMFSVDGETDDALGLPGRVFRQKVPEWTPNVLYYSNKEYSRRDHALNHNVRGTLALPVFELAGQSCVGVLELIMTSPKINYAPEADKVCKALEAVNLKSSKILDHPNVQICNEGRQNALAEISEILTVVCETHKLPLAQTWVPCMHRSVLANGGGLKKSCTSFDGSCDGRVCMSITDLAFYVVDAHMWGFREACLEHHLQKGQGVAGRAFLSHNSCFCRDITQFCKTEYPLVHYARWFGLTSCFAICLRSSHTGDDDYVLEFFLPPSITNRHEQKTFLGTILATLKQHLQSLRVASGMDLEEEEGFVEIIEASISGTVNLGLECILIPQSAKSPSDANPLPNGGMMALLDSSKHQPRVDLDAVDNGAIVTYTDKNTAPASASVPESKEKKKTSERKRGKTEKSISLEVLQQYFAGSLKDAAKSLGVCPTTMKRICRQHGISRWPSRKINKVNRSLSKLKRVIESVQGADGTFSVTPLATSPLPVAVGSISWPSNLNACSPQNSPNSIPYEPHGIKNGSPTPGSGQVGVEDHLVGGSAFSQEQPLQNRLSPELNEASIRSKTGSGSREESAGSPTSHGSCQGSPANECTPAKERSVSPVHEQCIKAAGSPELVLRPVGEHCLLPAYSIPDIRITTELQEPFGGLLIEDSGSSKDLRNLCPSVADAIIDERIPESSWTNPQCQDIPPAQILTTPTSTPAMAPFSARPEMKTIKIKATYREDIIRFRISLNSGIVELREEVAKRLKLEVGTFDIKYLDDDHEWVLIACDADLQECVDISRSSCSNIIRLSVHDVLGSSCESTGDL